MTKSFNDLANERLNANKADFEAALGDSINLEALNEREVDVFISALVRAKVEAKSNDGLTDKERADNERVINGGDYNESDDYISDDDIERDELERIARLDKESYKSPLSRLMFVAGYKKAINEVNLAKDELEAEFNADAELKKQKVEADRLEAETIALDKAIAKTWPRATVNRSSAAIKASRSRVDSFIANGECPVSLNEIICLANLKEITDDETLDLLGLDYSAYSGEIVDDFTVYKIMVEVNPGGLSINVAVNLTDYNIDSHETEAEWFLTVNDADFELI